MLNVHHLELFYYVAKHGGISAAARQIPHGIQQPAVSGAMSKLEEDLGTSLFERSPFRLTAPGEKLFARIAPFFHGLGAVEERLRATAEPVLRLGGAELVLRDHVPLVMRRVREKNPETRLSLHSGVQAQVEEWLRANQIDLAITSAGPRPPARLRQLPLLRIPLVLLVHRTAPWKSAEELWAQKQIPARLVAQPAVTAFMQSFQRDLKRRRIVWPQALEATSVELVWRYVASGEGYGVVNEAVLAGFKGREVRALPLVGFEPMTMAALWRGEPTPLIRTVIEEMRRYVQITFPAWACDDKLP